MKQLRWYDKDSRLKSVFEFIQSFDNSIQDEIAKDIIQILLNDLNINLDEKLNEMSRRCDYEYKRWYDRNADLFSSFELIKNLPDELKREVVRKIAESVLLMYFEDQSNG